MCVRGTPRIATEFKVKSVPAVVFTDMDGTEIHRAGFYDEKALLAAMETALSKYQPRPISWKTERAAGPKKLLVVGFDGGEGDLLKTLEDRSLAKVHDSCEFVKLPFEKDGEAAKKWGVTSAPAVVLADAAAEAPEKSPLEKLSGKKSPLALKAAIQRALSKLEKK